MYMQILLIITARLYMLQLSYHTDSIFLLGTGKTLVSTLVVGHMLHTNPDRPVMFLVDKILLALQQYQVLQDELGHKDFDR